MKPIPRLFACSAALALVAACGGGSGGDSAAPAPAPSSNTATITASNQTSVARAAFAGTQLFSDAQSPLAADERAQALSATPRTRAAGGAVVAAVRRGLALAQPQRRTAQGAAARPLAIRTVSDDCALSGTVSLVFDDRDNNDFYSAGDVLSVTWVQCRDTDKTLVNGTLSYSFTGGSRSSAQFSYQATVAVQQLVVVDGPTTTSADGSMTIAVTDTPILNRVVVSVGPNGLTSSVSGPNYNDTVVIEAGSTIDVAENLGAFGTTVETICIVNGAIRATSIGGRVSVTTLQPVRHRATDAYPHAGQVRVEGVNGAQLRITVLDATQVRLELDSDGNGSFESSTVVAWSTLLP